jgi:hypothetical protein
MFNIKRNILKILSDNICSFDLASKSPNITQYAEVLMDDGFEDVYTLILEFLYVE